MKHNELLQERVPKIVYQFSIHARNEKALKLPRAVLLNLGYLDRDLINSFLKNKPTLQLFGEDQQKFNKVKALFDRLKLKGIKVSLNLLKPKDWLTRWKAQWRVNLHIKA